MRRWPRGVEACAQCTGLSDANDYGGKDSCKRCYGYLKKIESATKWKRDTPETWQLIPKLFHDTVARFDPQSFEEFRCRVIMQLQRHLYRRRRRQDIRYLRHPVDALMIEQKIGKLARYSNAKLADMGVAGVINSEFDSRQQAIIYDLLCEITDSSPVRTIEWAKALDRL